MFDISDLFVLMNPTSLSCVESMGVRSYHQFFSYKKHLYRSHPEVLRTTGTSPPASGDLGDNDLLVELGSDNPHQETGLSDNNQGETADTFSISPHDLKRSGAMFILKISESKCLTLSTVNDILADIQTLTETTIRSVQSKVYTVLRSSGINPEMVPTLHSCFEHECNPFAGLETE